jgi:MFS family permease
MPPSGRSASSSGRYRVSIWPAITTTFLVGCGFAALKFVLIGRLALDWDPAAPGALDAVPWQWLRDVILAAKQRGGLEEAISQTMSAVLTLGLLLGFAINAPLAGAWRCSRLFAASTAAVGLGCLCSFWFNPWPWALFVGIAYGAACAARGKVVPLLSRAVGASNTLISGGINAALAIGLLTGTIAGSLVSEHIPDDLGKHTVLVLIAAVGTTFALFVRVPEPPAIPFARGLKDLITATFLLFRRHWPLLAGGGLAWGITAGASLAVFVDAVDRLKIPRGEASILAGFAAVGAIVGNLVSHYGARRRWVIGAFLGLAGAIGLYTHLVTGYWSAAVAVAVIGFLFAAPANVLDARFLANAHDDGLAGLGGTVMSFVHSLFIFAIGLALAVPLFLGVMDADTQFIVLAGIAVLTAAVSGFARIREP